MKYYKLIMMFGVTMLMLTACSKHEDGIVDELPPTLQQTDGTGIDDLHGTQTDKPAYIGKPR